MTKQREKLRILVVRREQIGDLVCTTPLLRMLRRHFSSAFIACLVNSYAAPILDGNPDVDAVYIYEKPRHSKGWMVALGAFLRRLRLYFTLLTHRFDYVILATTPYLYKDIRLLKSILPKHTVALGGDNNPVEYVDIPAYYDSGRPLHIIEKLGALTTAIGIPFQALPVKVYPDIGAVSAASDAIGKLCGGNDELIGIHISARAPSQRWPADSFVELIRSIYNQRNCRFMLFWSPGEKDNLYYPGDDSKMEYIMERVGETPVLAYSTRKIQDLIAGLSLCNFVVCSDGGAMHIAAGLGKPIVCFFSSDHCLEWHPWCVPHSVLKPESQNVADVSVETAVKTCQGLFSRQ